MIRKALLAIAGSAFLVFVTLGLTTNHSYVRTPSMWPTIPPGSMVFVSKQAHYHVGDVIEFRNNGIVWAHRIVAVGAGGAYITKGDNPSNSRDIFDMPTTDKDVIGKVVAAPRWLGFPQLIASDPSYGLAWLRGELGLAGRLLLITMCGVLACLPGMVRWLRGWAARRRQPAYV